MKLSQSNFNLRSPDSDLVRSYLLLREIKFFYSLKIGANFDDLSGHLEICELLFLKILIR